MKNALLLVISLCAASLTPRLARACGASAPTEWKLEGVVPASGGTIPTDGAIVIEQQGLAPVGFGNPDATTVVVTVRDVTGAEVPGSAGIWFDAASSLVWTPKAPLPASAILSLQASVGAPSSAPGSTDGTMLSATIQTAAGPAEALRITGDLTISYEPFDEPTVSMCPNDCGTSCVPGPPLHVLRARVTIPPVTGGFAPTDYLAWLWLTDNVPHVLPDGPASSTIALGGVERLGDGQQPTVAFRDVPKESQDYAPCFSVRVVDPAGHFEDRKTCLPKVDVTATLATLDKATATGGAGASGTSSSGCSLGGASAVDAGAALWLLVGMLAATRRPRRARSVLQAWPCRSGRSPSEG